MHILYMYVCTYKEGEESSATSFQAILKPPPRYRKEKIYINKTGPFQKFSIQNYKNNESCVYRLTDLGRLLLKNIKILNTWCIFKTNKNNQKLSWNTFSKIPSRVFFWTFLFLLYSHRHLQCFFFVSCRLSCSLQSQQK